MKPFLEVVLGNNPELNAEIKAAVRELQSRHRACINIRNPDSAEAEAKIVDEQANRKTLVTGAEQVIGFIAGYSRLADGVRALV